MSWSLRAPHCLRAQLVVCFVTSLEEATPEAMFSLGTAAGAVMGLAGEVDGGGWGLALMLSIPVTWASVSRLRNGGG